MKTYLTLMTAVAWLASHQSLASDIVAPSSAERTLARVPAAELPSKAAALVKAAKPTDRAVTTVGVVKAAVALNPAASPAVVGAIARAVPEMAPVAAGTAAQERPDRAAAIAKAAAAAAPQQAGKVVAAVCRAVPNAYSAVALAALEGAPGSETEILMALASVYPELKPGVERALAGGTLEPSPVAGLLGSTKPTVYLLSDAGPGATTPIGTAPVTGTGPGMPRGPTIAPPFVPLSSTVSNVNPTTSGNVPPGGRNYAAP